MLKSALLRVEQQHAIEKHSSISVANIWQNPDERQSVEFQPNGAWSLTNAQADVAINAIKTKFNLQ